MRFIPTAIVYHYHRPTWEGFFRQQFNNAVINIFLSWKHKDKIFGDHISTTSMGISLGFAYLTVGFLLLSAFYKPPINLTLISLAILALFYLRDIFRISKSLSDVPVSFGILVVRTVAWMIGWITGLFLFFKRKWYKGE